MKKLQVTLLFLALFFTAFSQRGKDGDYTVTGNDVVVNTYTHLTSNVSAGGTALTVNSNNLTGAGFTGSLQAGDLILIYQVQGLDVDINPYIAQSWGDYTVQQSYYDNGNNFSFIEFGSINNYKNAGRYEFHEVRSVSGNTTINLTCGVSHNYRAENRYKTQVIRVPRYKNLTVPNNRSITTPAWNGVTGGVVAVEVEEDLAINGSGKITADEKGFRGGEANGDGSMSGPAGSIPDTNGRGYLGSNNYQYGAGKGESVYGTFDDYSSELYSKYGYGAVANGGGGGGRHNAGGGGGSNVGTGVYKGYGVVDRGPGNVYDQGWNIEHATLINVPSAGGGRGGYSHAANNREPFSVPPHDNSWDEDYRRIAGGVGGHPLDYDLSRVFLGGGGGGGHQNNDEGGSGGNGGGAIFINVYGNVSGNGRITANGADGEDAEGAQPTIVDWNTVTGADGAGGAGGGGSVVIKNINLLPASLNIEAKGGKGGDEIQKTAPGYTKFEANGPGGGGAGGLIAYSTGNPSQNINGGFSGTTNARNGSNSGYIASDFPVNGATKGAVGMDSQQTEVIDFVVENDTVCYGTSTTLTVNVLGNMTSTINWYTSYSGSNVFATGTSINTPNMTSTQTLYVGTCDAPFRIPVEIYVLPQISTSPTPPAIADETCFGNDGSISGIILSGGTGNLSFEWNGIPHVGPNLNNASAGTYTLVITDERGCTLTMGPYTIGHAADPTINSTNVAITPETCIGGDGTITGITASGGQAPYTYTWNGVASGTIDFTGSAGSYTLEVTDANGCTVSEGVFTIPTSSTISINTSNLVIVDETCNGNDGSITGVTASGGTGTLTYSWSNGGGSGLDVNNAGAGSYTLTVTDGVNCSATSGPHEINLIPNPTIDISGMDIQNVSCNGNDGSITGITVSGGTTPYTYDWNGNASPSADLNGVSDGFYTLTVTDANGCATISNSFEIELDPPLVLDETGIDLTDATCNGNDGSISGITVSGGTAPYTYDWNGVSSPTIDLSNAGAGNYTLTVTDANGCVISNNTPYTINVIPDPSIDDANISITDESCFGYDGGITGITVSGGTAPYTYDWNGSTSTGIDLVNANATDYTLTVTDANGCSATAGPYTVGSVPAIVIDVSGMDISAESCTGGDGSITGILASGGEGTLTYSWSSGETTLDLENVTAGSYTLTVTDDLGCSETAGPYNIGSTPSPTIDDSGVIIVDETCNGNDGSITGLVVSGGTTPYTYLWNSTVSTTADLEDAVGGTYTLIVVDANNCSATAGPFTVVESPGPAIDASGLIITGETCHGEDGSIEGLTVSNGLPPYVLTWNGDVVTGADLNDLEAGDYTFTVTDANGCSASSGPHSVDAYPNIVIDETNLVVSDATCNGGGGSISGLAVSGGVGTLSYAWSTGETTLDIANAAPGVYTLTVTDGVGCTEEFGPYTIQQTGAPIINVDNMIVTDATCGDDNGSITGITVTGGTLPYTYDWNGTSSTGTDITDLSVGSYTLTVTDANGCVVIAGPYLINAIPMPVIDESNVSVADESCDGKDGSISGITVSGGTTPYNYVWTNNVSSTVDAEDLGAGSYTLTVTDTNGCSVTSSSFTINGPIIPTVNITTPDQTIETGESVNVITVVTPTNSSINWTPGDGMSCTNCPNPTITPEESGWYYITATSVDGCTAQDSIYIQVDDPCGVIELPTVFSPNGDGLNDLFCVLGGCLNSMELQVYNRWGERVYQSNDINDCWDGTYKGSPVNSGVYIFQFIGEKTDGTTVKKSGNVNLVR